MEKYVRQIATESLRNEQGEVYGTVHIVQPCAKEDDGAIQISPLDCVPYELWGYGEIQRDVWDQHSYRVVGDGEDLGVEAVTDEKAAIIQLLRNEIKVIKTGTYGPNDEVRMNRIIQRIEDNLKIKPSTLPPTEQDEYEGPTKDKDAFGDSYDPNHFNVDQDDPNS